MTTAVFEYVWSIRTWRANVMVAWLARCGCGTGCACPKESRKVRYPASVRGLQLRDRIFDTNVLISGLMHPDSTPGRIVAAWAESEFDVVSSPKQLAEIARVLGYFRIRRVLK